MQRVRIKVRRPNVWNRTGTCLLTTRKRYYILGKPWSDGHISLKKFDIFQFGLSYTLYEILDFNFASASSEGSDEPVHLQNLDTVFAVLRIADEGSDEILANIFIPTHKGLN